jgi:hypothetical protein
MADRGRGVAPRNLVIGVNAERMSLEDVAEPLSSARRSSASRMEGPNPLVS